MGTHSSMTLLFLIVSALCLAIATLIGSNEISGNWQAWTAGGLLAYVLSVLLGGVTLPFNRQPPA